MPAARSIPGITHENTNPSSTAEMTTSSTAIPPIAVKSRRKSIVGREAAAA